MTLVPGRGGLSQPDPGKAQLQHGHQVQPWHWGLLQLLHRTPVTAGGGSAPGGHRHPASRVWRFLPRKEVPGAAPNPRQRGRSSGIPGPPTLLYADCNVPEKPGRASTLGSAVGLTIQHPYPPSIHQSDLDFAPHEGHTPLGRWKGLRWLLLQPSLRSYYLGPQQAEEKQLAVAEKAIGQLQQRSREVAPLPLRRNPPKQPLQLDSICDWDSGEVQNFGSSAFPPHQTPPPPHPAPPLSNLSHL